MWHNLCSRTSIYSSLTEHYIDNRHGEAIGIIAQVRGKNIDCLDPAVLKQKKDIDDAVALEEADGPGK